MIARHLLPTLLLLTACTAPPPVDQRPVAATDTTATMLTTGHQVVHTKDGGRMEGMLRDGQRDGSWAAYFPNGTIQSRRIYANGVEQGPAEVFHPNGMTFYRGHYQGGMRTGTWEFFDEQGELVKTVTYDSLGVEIR